MAEQLAETEVSKAEGDSMKEMQALIQTGSRLTFVEEFGPIDGPPEWIYFRIDGDTRLHRVSPDIFRQAFPHFIPRYQT